jgi:hypothetical protein
VGLVLSLLLTLREVYGGAPAPPAGA